MNRIRYPAMASRFFSILVVTMIAGCHSQPPEELRSNILGSLRRESVEMPDGVVYFYTTTVNLPNHQNVDVVIHPNGSAALHADLREAETRYQRLSSAVDSIVASDTEKLRQLFLQYFPDKTNVPAAALLQDLRLTHIKIIIGGADELIFYGNPHYPSLDLNLSVKSDNTVADYWFDG